VVVDASGYPLSRKKKKGMVRVPPIADAFASMILYERKMNKSLITCHLSRR
jgi:hypothetical protein